MNQIRLKHNNNSNKKKMSIIYLACIRGTKFRNFILLLCMPRERGTHHFSYYIFLLHFKTFTFVANMLEKTSIYMSEADILSQKL